MSVFDELKQLENRRQELLEKAKQDALSRAEKAVAELNDLGFSYRLVSEAEPAHTRQTAPREPGTRRTGIRQEVITLLDQHPDGLTRKQILEAMEAEDKRDQQAISNALANAKKKGEITLEDGIYKLVHTE